MKVEFSDEIIEELFEIVYKNMLKLFDFQIDIEARVRALEVEHGFDETEELDDEDE